MGYEYDQNNIFAKILRNEIPNQTVLETMHSFAFKDINPVAPIHVLVIPKGEYVNCDHFLSTASSDEQIDFNGAVSKVIHQYQLDPNSGGDGYRIIANGGKDGVQEVPHFHFHIIGGKNMGPMIVR